MRKKNRNRKFSRCGSLILGGKCLSWRRDSKTFLGLYSKFLPFVVVQTKTHSSVPSSSPPFSQHSARQQGVPFTLPKYTASSTSHSSSTADPPDSVPTSCMSNTKTPSASPPTLTPARALSPCPPRPSPLRVLSLHGSQMWSINQVMHTSSLLKVWALFT